MSYILPEAYTLTPAAQDTHNERQEAITRFFQNHILPVKEKGRYTFSYKYSEIAKTFTAESFISILKETGYRVSYGTEIRELYLLATKETLIRGGNNTLNDEGYLELFDDRSEDRMTIYWGNGAC